MDKPRVPNLAKLSLVGVFQSFDDAFCEFRQRHSEWVAAHLGKKPTYRLPVRAIEILQREWKAAPILTPADARAELAFTKFCGHDALGIWQDKWILLPCLAPTAFPGVQELLQCGLTRTQALGAQQAAKHSAEISRRLKGVVGWLSVDPEFLNDRDALRRRWESLPARLRLKFPLQRAMAVPATLLKGKTRAEANLARFGWSLEQLLDRWGLQQLVTWELPEPQGPLLPVPRTQNPAFMPQHGLQFFVPTHYSVSSTDTLQSKIRHQQIRLAHEHQVDSSSAGMSHSEVYGHMLEIVHLERTIASRYPKRYRAVQAIERAAAAVLGYKLEYVRKLRRAISACRRGKKDSISWLKARSK
jgi:hypothetical protein